MRARSALRIPPLRGVQPAGGTTRNMARSVWAAKILRTYLQKSPLKASRVGWKTGQAVEVEGAEGEGGESGWWRGPTIADGARLCGEGGAGRERVVV